MERLWQILRDQPVLAGIITFLVIFMLVIALVGGAMQRAGVSLRPVVFFVIFFGIVAGPQIAIHILNALLAQQTPPPAQSTSLLQPVSWDQVFGINADPALVIDAKISLDAIFHDASKAQLSASADGASTLAARFDSADAAAEAQGLFRDFFQMTDAKGDALSGWTGRRFHGQGEWVHLVVVGPELYAWIGQTRDGVLARRPAALGEIPNHSAHKESRGVVIDYLERRPRSLTLFILVNLLCAVLWFFKGSTWAARVDPPVGTSASSAAVLRDLLQAEDPATRIIPNPDGDLEVTWRYDDEQWLQQMRLQRVRTAHRLVLHFDEASQVVRVRESWTALDTSPGIDRAQWNWMAITGISFFHSGNRTMPSGSYKFDVQELRAPLISTVVSNGWRWQPLVWNTPTCLRWLLE